MEPRRFSRRALFTSPAVKRAEVADFLVRVHRRAMACRFEVVLPGERNDQMPIARAALDEADRLEDLLTIFRETSDLSRVNRLAHEERVSPDPELFALLRDCAALHEATEGAFDITSTPLSRCWGFLRREGRRPLETEIAEARELVGMHLVEIDPVARTVFFRRPGVMLNLGSIGKGFALDRLCAFLRANGVRHALISAGASSLVAMGGAQRPWQIDLRPVATGQRVARLLISEGGVGTSGSGEQFFEVNGVRYGHVIDPRTGQPASGVLSATVVAPRAAAADALSTALLIGGCELAERYCADHQNVLAIITPDDGSNQPVVFGSSPGASVEFS